MKGLVYLSFPYPYAFTDVAVDRANMARRWCQNLLQLEFVTLCPHLHHHTISPEPAAYKFSSFSAQVLPLIGKCDALQVLMFPGWEESYNVSVEIQYAKAAKIPITYVNTQDLEEWCRLRNVAFAGSDLVRESDVPLPSLEGVDSVEPTPSALEVRRQLRDAESVDGGRGEERSDNS